jgi:carbamoyl-phosphate synthase small subunit
MTYPEIGNYGINTFDFESDKVHARGFIIKNYCEKESHYQSSMTLSEYLKNKNVIGISGIDTRYLTSIIRESGAMNCVVTTEEITGEIKKNLKAYSISKDVSLIVSRTQIDRIKNPGGIGLAVIDTGVKKSILENLKSLGCDLTVFPADVNAGEILNGKFDAVVISIGPGDPQDAVKTINTAQNLAGKIPLYGICLGYQILSIVLGAKTYKLKYGHRGGNHPVINLETNKVIITSQNHGYATDVTTLPKNAIATYQNLNDGTLEGFRCPEYGIEAVQFHPEAAPGPSDANLIIENWVNVIRANKSTGFKKIMKKISKGFTYAKK